MHFSSNVKLWTSLVCVLGPASLLRAQAGPLASPIQATSEAVVSLPEALPDAPSFSSSQQQPIQKQPTPPTPAVTVPPQDTTPPKPPAPAQETQAEKDKREHDEAEREVKQQEKQRNFGVLPNFTTVLNGHAVPLTAGEKFDLAYHSSVDPVTFATAFILAGYGEISDSHQGYHWGPKGYFKRVGANYADTVDGTFWGNALLPSVLHQDPRYYREGSGPKKQRLIHAVLSTVICKGDNGKNQFNVSNVAGNFISGAISNIYYPSNETGFGLTIQNASTVTAEGALAAIFLEFAPDIQRHFHHPQPTPTNTVEQRNAVPPTNE